MTNQTAERFLKEYNSRKKQLLQTDAAVANAIWPTSGLATQRVVIADYYSQVQIGAKTGTDGDLFSKSVTAAVGHTNLNNGKPPVGEYMLVIAIQLLFVASANPEKADYTMISDLVRSGELEISQDNRPIFPVQGMECFNTENQTCEIGTVEVTPVFLKPDRWIRVIAQFHEALGATDCLKLRLIGAKNVRM